MKKQYIFNRNLAISTSEIALYLKLNSIISFGKHSFTLLLLGFLLLTSGGAYSQCGNYQNLESFSNAFPSSAGTWVRVGSALTLPVSSTALPRTGTYHATFSAINVSLQTPQIAAPGVFSFWYARNAITTDSHTFTVETSPDASAWTPRGTTTMPAATSVYQQFTVDLGALGLTNVYVRIRDTRASGTANRYVDDISWTSTGSNLLIPSIGSCSQSVVCGTTYNFTDGGSTMDSYGQPATPKDYTMTFTPTTAGSKVRMIFSAFNTISTDGLAIYDGPTTGSPIFNSGLPANGANCPAGSFYGTTSPGTITSSDAGGAITIRFRSTGASAVANVGWLAAVSCFVPTVCTTPTAQPTTLLLTTTSISSISGSFTPASPVADKYLVVRSTSPTAPSPGPVNGTTYIAGNTISGSTVISASSATSFTATGLTPNTIYYFYVYSLNDVACTGGPAYLTTSPLTNNISTYPIAANDVCSSATTILSNVSCSATVGSTIGATDNNEVSDCGIGTENAVWYKFVAVATTETVLVTGAVNGFNVVAGAISTCGTATVPTGGACANVNSSNGSNESLSLTGLTIGNTYYVQVYDLEGDNTASGFTICVTHPAPCPAPNAQPTALTFGAITTSSIAGSFTAASPAASKYLVVYSTSATPPSPGPVNGTTYIAGNTFSGATVVSASTATTFTASGLTPNTTYYFYVYSYNEGACSGPTYLGTSPLTNNATTINGVTNDICNTSILLISNTTCSPTTGSTLAATDNNETGDCTLGTENAVWFKFVAQNAISTVTVASAAGFDAVIGAITACGTATIPTGGTCTNATLGGGTETLSLTGLTVGATYFVQVYDFNGLTTSSAFTICVTHPGPCTTPTAQPTGLTFNSVTPNSISGSFTGATPAPGRYLVVRSTSPTAPSPGPANGTAYTVGGTFSGATVVSIINSTTFTASGLTGGTQYYFYIYSYNDVTCTSGPLYNTASPLTGTSTTLPAPANFVCSGAITLNCAGNLSGTTIGAPGTPPGTGACAASNFGAWYTFVGDGSITTVSSTGTSGWDHLMYISSGSCGSFTNIACQNSAASNGTETFTFTAVTAVNYYIYIATPSGAVTGNFTISRTCAPPPPPMTNDECATAISLTPNAVCTYVYYTNAGATTSSTAGTPAPGCANYMGGDIWFKIVVPANGILNINTIANTITDGGMALYTGSCGGLTLVTCNDASSPNPGNMPLITATGLAAGTTVFVRFWESGNNVFGPFGICVTSPGFCTTGTGIGTSALGCPNVTAGGLNLDGVDPAPIDACLSSTCTDLEATYLLLGQPTSYTVTPISPYTPPYQFGCLANPVSVNVDDIWSPVVTLPFNFCFYGNTYTQCLIGSNGTLTFDLGANTPGGFSNWSFSTNLPSASLFRNTIFGVYQDIDPSKGGTVGYELITLYSGCRALVVAWNDIPMYSLTCNSLKYTGMMVLYENTNIIEIYVQEKNTCASWNGGNAIIGIQNATATQFAAPAGRNDVNNDWSTTNEAWRFTPSGPSVASVKWYQGAGTTGPVVGTTQTISVCPTATTTYTAEVTYTLCTGGTVKETDQTTVTVTGSKAWNGSISTDWATAGNWTPVGVPTALDCVIVPVTSPLRNPIISGTNYSALCKTISVLNGAGLTVNSSNSITVTNWVNVGTTGNFTVQNNASLVQVSDSAINVGKITYKRDAPNVKAFDYVYWSSPVSGFNVNSITSPLASGPVYTWNPTINNPNLGQGNWESATSSTMIPGKGYIVRAPGTFTATPATLSGSFNGIPNNGVITTPISRGSYTGAPYAGANGTMINNLSDNNNLLGNPYPSAIRGSQFLFNNNTKIDGNIRLWTHGASPAQIGSPFYNSFLYNYDANDYISFNWTGTTCCPAAASDLFVAGGQGFFVYMLDGPTGSDVVTFNNSLRSASYSNSVFYRTMDHSSSSSVHSEIEDLERNRIWLDLINPDGMSNRTLLGYIEGATMDTDHFYDAKAIMTNALGIFSVIDDENFVIQGRQLPFDSQDVVPLAVHTPSDGIYKIGIGGVDGLFENAFQHIYLEDRTAGIIHDMRLTPYSFDAVEGDYKDRFFLRYTDSALGVTNPDAENGLSALITGRQLMIEASQKMESVEIYDVAGKLVRTFSPKESRLISDFNYASGVYFAKIKLENGMIFTKKLLNK